MPISSPTPGNLFQGTNAVEVRSGATAQSIFTYGSYTDASNWSRLALALDAGFGVYRLGPEALGTGASRGLLISGGPANNLYFAGSQGTGQQWGILSAGHFQPWADATYDFGATAARVKNIYASGFVRTGSKLVSALTAAATAGAGARDFVTDATAVAFLSVVAGGGANKVPVVSDGTNWLIG
jgi:hypothetical protein